MKAKDVLVKMNAEVEKGLKAIGKEDIKVRVRPRLVRYYIGVYFELEMTDRISKRYRGEVPESAMWSFKKEAHAWAQKLIALTGSESIDMAHFDRITDSAISKYNTNATELRHATAAALRASRKQDVKSLADSGKSVEDYTKKPDPVTLGETLGVK